MIFLVTALACLCIGGPRTSRCQGHALPASRAIARQNAVRCRRDLATSQFAGDECILAPASAMRNSHLGTVSWEFWA
jgi:hypothetical protein